MGKKKSEPAAPTRQEQLAAAIYQINAALNAEVPRAEWREYVQSADKVTSPFILRRRTGIIDLDIAMGGGFPAGGPVQIAAEDGVGKNAMCLQTIAECQRVYGDESAIGWCCTEITFDKPFAHLFGVAVPMSDSEIEMEEQARKAQGWPKLTKLDLEERRRAVGNFVVIDTGPTAKRLDAVVELVRSNLFQIVVIDSVAAILTGQRDDTPLDEFSQQSSEAFLLTEFQKKLWGAYAPQDDGTPNFTTLIETNQVRDKRNLKKNNSFQRKWEARGARALKHAKLADIVLVRKDQIEATVVDDSDPNNLTPRKRRMVVGKKVGWEIAKGKAGFHEGPKGIIEYHYDTGFQVEKNLVDTALAQDVIVQLKQGVYGVINHNGEVVEEVRGKNALYVKADDPAWFNTLYTMTLRKAGISCLFKL